MFRKTVHREPRDKLIPVPTRLPPLAGLDKRDRVELDQRRQTSHRTLALAIVVIVMLLAIVGLGVLGALTGLRDRTASNRQAAQEHYALGLQHLQAGEYELAVAEFELARHYDRTLPDLQSQLQKAKALAQAQFSPTSEARQDASISLYRQAVTYYESGELEQAVALLEELHSLDADYQQRNVVTMLCLAQYELGQAAVREDRLGEAVRHFEAVLAIASDPEIQKQTQEQLNLLDLYKAALSHWNQDWPATIQALKGLYSLAPDYKDVRTRLHDAYVLYAQQYVGRGDWCQAAVEYASAAQVFPLEETVDKRDDADIQCQVAANRPTPTPVSRARATATGPASGPTAVARATPTPVATVSPGTGRIVYPRVDAARQRRDLYVLDLSQAESTLLVENACQPAFSPDAGRLAFRNLDPNHQELGIVDLYTRQVSELTEYVEDSTPTWSPDATQLVFASNRESDRIWRIYVISPLAFRDVGNQWGYGQMPAWAPDGSGIAYHGCDPQGRDCAVWVMQPGGFNSARLTTDPSDTSPSWKPDSTQVAFASSRTGNWELYIADRTNGTERRLTNHPAIDVAPVWSPDGKRLAFLSNRDGEWAIYVLDVKTSKVQKLIATGDDYPDPLAERLAWVP